MVVLLWSWSVSAYDQCPPLMGMASWCQPMVRCSVFWAELVKSSNPICYGRSHSEGSTIRSACCPMVLAGHSQFDSLCLITVEIDIMDEKNWCLYFDDIDAMGLIRETQVENELTKVPPHELNKVMDGRRELSRLAAFEKALPDYMPFLSGSNSVTETALMGQLGLMVTKTTQKFRQLWVHLIELIIFTN